MLTGGEMPFVKVSCAALKSKWHGESEKLIEGLYRMADNISPSIIFIGKLCNSKFRKHCAV